MTIAWVTVIRLRTTTKAMSCSGLTKCIRSGPQQPKINNYSWLDFNRRNSRHDSTCLVQVIIFRNLQKRGWVLSRKWSTLMNHWGPQSATSINRLVQGKTETVKPWFLPSNIGFSCKFSLKPTIILWFVMISHGKSMLVRTGETTRNTLDFMVQSVFSHRGQVLVPYISRGHLAGGTSLARPASWLMLWKPRTERAMAWRMLQGIMGFLNGMIIITHGIMG